MKEYSFCLFRNWLALMVNMKDFDKTKAESIPDTLNKYKSDEVEFVFKENKKVTRGEDEFQLRLYYVDGDVDEHSEEIRDYLENRLGIEERAIAYGLRKE